MLEKKKTYLYNFNSNTFKDDQLWIGELIRFTQGTDIFSTLFLENAHLGTGRMYSILLKFTFFVFFILSLF